MILDRRGGWISQAAQAEGRETRRIGMCAVYLWVSQSNEGTRIKTRRTCPCPPWACCGPRILDLDIMAWAAWRSKQKGQRASPMEQMGS